VQRLALFPLGTVLVPGLLLPLRVFEPRYRTLMADLLERPEAERVFGVVAIRAGHEVGAGGVQALYEVGTTAVVREVTDAGDGTVAVLTSGAVRFRLHGLDDAASTPYLTGLVSALEDLDGDDADVPALARSVGLRYTDYRLRLGAQPADLPASPRVLSYLVAAGMSLDVADRQRLLEAPDTARRLVAELALLARERVLVEATRSLPHEGGWPAPTPN
jgi:Lon protease-like protein